MANENLFTYNTHNYPQNYPVYMSGSFTHKIVMKLDHVRTDGTCSLYLQVYVNKERKKFPLNISVAPKDFDKTKQRIKGTHKFCKDFNLIIEKKLADINNIQVNYRLSEKTLTLSDLLQELNNPNYKLDFI